MSSQWSASAPSATQGEVGAVPALGHQQAEVEGRAGDPLRGVLGPHVPRAVRRGQLDPERLGRRRPAVDPVGEVAGAHAEVGDVPQPGGRHRGARRARRRRPGRAPRSPSAGRWPSRRRSSAARTRHSGPAGRRPARRPGAARPVAPAGQQLPRLLLRALPGGGIDEGVRVGQATRARLSRTAAGSVTGTQRKRRRSRPGARSGGRWSSPAPASGCAQPAASAGAATSASSSALSASRSARMPARSAISAACHGP